MYDRRFYHVILVEDQNYKVTIYNYNNKVTKFTQYDTKNNLIQDNDFEYNFFIYDYKSSIISGKKITSILSERNENWWSKYDLQLNDLQKNIKTFKFNNEINFLLYSKSNFLKFNDKSKPGIKSYTSQHIKSTSDKSSPVVTYTHMKSLEMPISPLNGGSKNNSIKKLATISPTNANDSDESFPDKLKNLFKSIDGYLAKYNFKGVKISETIENVELNKLSQVVQADRDKNLYHNIYIRQLADWMLVLFNKFYNETNAFYFSVRWLSCNSIPIHNFNRELNKKVKLSLILGACCEYKFSKNTLR
jgi:hypothetical protein